MKAKHMMLVLAASSAAVFAPAASAADVMEPVDKYFFSLGLYRASNDVDLRWEPTTGTVPGTSIDVERDLGIDLDGTAGVFEAGASFGPGGRHLHPFETFRYGSAAS